MMVKDEAPEPLRYTAERFSLLDDGGHIIDEDNKRFKKQIIWSIVLGCSIIVALSLVGGLIGGAIGLAISTLRLLFFTE